MIQYGRMNELIESCTNQFPYTLLDLRKFTYNKENSRQKGSPNMLGKYCTL